ncbi:MAG: SigE family RNA polymerase sigma factor [Demequinaceae bacterium]|nr:SigE family RNA polymerase sigma factor [Demequinaceae bacterium]
MAEWQGFYTELATTRYPALLAYATALTGQRAAAEDLLQDAFVRVFSRWRRLEDAHHAENYVRRAMATIYLDRLRRRATLARALVRAVEREAAPDQGDQIGERDAMSIALASLPPQVRVCIVLRFYDDLAIAEIASQLGLAVGTVKRYLSDGIAKLEQIVGGDAGHHDGRKGGATVPVVAPRTGRR